MRTCGNLLRFGIGVVIASWVCTAAQATADKVVFTELPVLVNIQPGVDVGRNGGQGVDDVDRNYLKDSIAATNEYFQRAKLNVKLLFDKDKDVNITPFTTGTTESGNDNKIESNEVRTAVNKSIGELRTHTGRAGKGYKLIFTDVILSEDSPYTGYTPRGAPVSIIKTGQAAPRNAGFIITLSLPTRLCLVRITTLIARTE